MKQMLRPPQFTTAHCVPRRLDLMEQLLKPQLVRLMNRDEQQLIVGGRIRLRHLLAQQFGQPQVCAIGEETALLTEPPASPRGRAGRSPRGRAARSPGGRSVRPPGATARN